MQRSKRFAVLFLDFDGVLVPWQSFRPTVELEWSEQAMEELNYICAEIPNLRVVISSQWRLQDLSDTRAKMLRLLRSKGFEGKLHRDWRTPGVKAKIEQRGHEIQRWIARHKNQVSAWVMLDDINPLLAEVTLPEQVKQRLVLTDSYRALRPADTARIIRIFFEQGL